MASRSTKSTPETRPPLLTSILLKIESGDLHEAGQLLPLVYEELRKLAATRLAYERPGQTLQATALVHEAYLRLVDVENPQHWKSRGHFFGAAAEAKHGENRAYLWPRILNLNGTRLQDSLV